MSRIRLLRYVILSWLVGAVILFAEVRAGVGGGVARALFYVGSIVLPLIFFGLYFRLSDPPIGWRGGVRIGIIWLLLLTAIDVIVYVWWLDIGWAAYFSLESWAGRVLFLVIGALIAERAARKRTVGRPPGLV